MSGCSTAGPESLLLPAVSLILHDLIYSTNPKIQYAAYYPTVCSNVTGYGPFVSEKDCASMAAALPRCQALVQKCYDNPSNAAVCLSANQYCEATQTER